MWNFSSPQAFLQSSLAMHDSMDPIKMLTGQRSPGGQLVEMGAGLDKKNEGIAAQARAAQEDEFRKGARQRMQARRLRQ